MKIKLLHGRTSRTSLPKCPLHPSILLPGWASFCAVCGHFVNCEDGRGLEVVEEVSKNSD